MMPGSCTSDANAAKDSRPGYSVGGHTVSAHCVKALCLLVNIDAGLLRAVSLAWHSLA